MKKKSILIPILLLPLFVISVLYFCGVWHIANAEFSYDFELKETYNKGDTLVLPKGSCIVSDSSYDCSFQTEYPDGRLSYNGSVYLDSVGEYSIKYSAKVGDDTYEDEKKINVINSFSGLFYYDENVSINTDVNIPNYISDSYVGSKKGISFCVKKNNSVINYNGIIDLKKLPFSSAQMVRDLTPNDLNQDFIELLITPNNNSTREFNTLEIKLTDIYDENNYLTIFVSYVSKGSVKDSIAGGAYITASISDKYDPIGYPENEIQADGNYSQSGCVVRSSFYGQSGSSIPSSMRFYFDNNTGALWGRPISIPYIQRYIIKDGSFSDPQVVGYENCWSGFTTGEVYCSITVKDLLSSSANFMILGIGGNRFDADLSTSENVIAIDYQEFNENDLPVALAGENSYFPVFDAFVYNETGGILGKPNVKVFYGDSNKVIAVKDGKFNTNEEGVYRIEYSLLTQYGYISKTLSITAINNQDYEFDYQVSGDLQSSLKIGDRFYILEGAVQGGQGNISIKKEVLYSIDDENWTKIEFKTVDNLSYFDIERTGRYKVEFTAKDFLGITVEKEFVCDVEDDAGPRMGLPYLPSKMVQGIKYHLYKPDVHYYNKNNSGTIITTIKINGIDYTDKDFYIGENAVDIEYKSYLEENPSIYTTQIIHVESVKIKTDIPEGDEFSQNLVDYFIVDNNSMDLSMVETGMAVSAKVNGSAALSFIKTLSGEAFSINIKVDKDNFKFDKFGFELIDKANVNQKVFVSVKSVMLNNAYYSLLCVNGQNICSINNSFDSGRTYMFKYNDGDLFIDGVKIYTFNSYENGDEFVGFTSGEVYLRFIMDGIEDYSQSKVMIESIMDQAFNGMIYSDDTAPKLLLEGKMALNNFGVKGDVINVYNAFAYDALNDVYSITLIITSPSGRTLYSGNAINYSFTLEENGKYVISYLAEDTVGNRKRYNYNVFTKDTIPPEIKVMSDVVQEISVGKTFTLPKVQVTDLSDESPQMIYIIESPTMRTYSYSEVQDISFNETGTYKLKILAFDSDSNYTCSEFKILVK